MDGWRGRSEIPGRRHVRVEGLRADQDFTIESLYRGSGSGTHIGVCDCQDEGRAVADLGADEVEERVLAQVEPDQRHVDRPPC